MHARDNERVCVRVCVCAFVCLFNHNGREDKHLSLLTNGSSLHGSKADGIMCVNVHVCVCVIVGCKYGCRCICVNSQVFVCMCLYSHLHIHTTQTLCMCEFAGFWAYVFIRLHIHASQTFKVTRDYERNERQVQDLEVTFALYLHRLEHQ
jgi:hypothetical protein